MTINVEGYGVQAPPAAREQLQTASRQGRWLFELEHALLLQSGKKPAPEGEPARQPADAGDPLRKRQRERDADIPAAAAMAATPAPRQPAVGVDGGTGAHAGAVDGAPAKATPSSAAAVDAAPPAATVAAHAAAAGAATTTTPALSAAWGAATGAPSPATVLGAYGAVAPRLAAAGPAAAASAVKAGAATPPGLTLAGAPAPHAPEREGEAGQVAPETADDGAGGAPADGDEYANRLLHVYRDAHGVQAWVRDAAIGEAQIPGLAQAMAAELGGARLAALTVNGKRQALPAAATPADGIQDEYMNDEAAARHARRPASPRDTNTNGAT